jgi:hypothetical protein
MIAGIFSYAVQTENKGLQENLRGFNGSQEIVTGLIDLLSAMLLVYLYAVMGQIDMLPVVGAGQTGVKTAINSDYFERRDSEFISSK